MYSGTILINYLKDMHVHKFTRRRLGIFNPLGQYLHLFHDKTYIYISSSTRSRVAYTYITNPSKFVAL